MYIAGDWLGSSLMFRYSKPILFTIAGMLAIAPATAQIVSMPYPPAPGGRSKGHCYLAPSAESPAVGWLAGSPKEPRALIRGWSLGSELSPSVSATGQAVCLDPGTNDVVFFFDAVAPAGGRTPVEFRYRLAEYDSEWTTTREKFAHYRRLPPARYRFEVAAHNAGQPWNTAVAVLPVEQRHFFYQTWYFYTLLIVGLTAVAVETLRQRDQLFKGQIAMVLEERSRIASDCHDTLMPGFAALNWQLEATSRLLSETTDRMRAAQSCQLARKIVTHCQADARRIIWDLQDFKEVTDMLSHALSTALNNMRAMWENPEIDFAVEGEEVSIAPTAVHHLVCVGQEAVTNAIRHSGCSTIWVRLTYDSDFVNLTVRDNGQGFRVLDTSGRNGHFGIPVMQERSRKLGGAFRIQTSLGSGTEISLKVDLKAIHRMSDQQEHLVPWIGV